MPLAARIGPLPRGKAGEDGGSRDWGTATHQALLRSRGGEVRELFRPRGGGAGVPGAQRRREDHHHAHDLRLPAAYLGDREGGRCGPGGGPPGGAGAHRLLAGKRGALPGNAGGGVPALSSGHRRG